MALRVAAPRQNGRGDRLALFTGLDRAMCVKGEHVEIDEMIMNEGFQAIT